MRGTESYPTCPDHSPCRCPCLLVPVRKRHLVVDPLSIRHSLVANRDSKLQSHFPNHWHRCFGCLCTFSLLSLLLFSRSSDFHYISIIVSPHPSRVKCMRCLAPLVFESQSSARNCMPILCALQGTTWPNWRSSNTLVECQGYQ